MSLITPAETPVPPGTATRHWRARAFQAYLVAATIAFGTLFILASQFNYFPIDLSITQSIQTINAPWFAALMWGVSFVGYTPQVWVLIGISVVMLFVGGLRWEAIMALVAALGVSGLGAVVKLIVHRPRPGADLVHVAQQLTDFSFPSGHVLLYTAFLGFIFFLVYTLLKPSAVRIGLLALVGGLIVLIGVSRIYLGNHWASDVTGAYLLGSLWLTFSITLYRWGKPRFFISSSDPPPHSRAP